MKQYTQGMDPIELIINDSILFFFSHFFPLFYFLMEAKLPNNYHLSVVIGLLFFWRILAKRIGRLCGVKMK